MDEKREKIINRFEELGQLLMDGAVLQDQQRYTQLAKEYSELSELAGKIRLQAEQKLQLAETIELYTAEDDAEMRDLIRAEQRELELSLEQLELDIQQLLIPADPNDSKSMIVEVRAGAGGEEAALFASVLLRMYQGFAELHNLSFEIVDLSETELGGLKEGIFELSGKQAYSLMKYESGVHRVQRVPVTESGGRIHTSTCTVAVMPEADEVELEINPNDLQIDTYRASGAGGQHVNKTSSAIRITHLPSGMVVTCQDERSQHKNKDKAMKVLRARLLAQEQEAVKEASDCMRKNQVGTGDRSERIRTYNYPQGRVSDHRIGLTLYRLEAILAGDLDEIVQQLRLAERSEEIAQADND